MTTMAPEQVIQEDRVSNQTQLGDKPQAGGGPVTHIVWIPEDKMKMSAAAYVMAARIEGLTIRALCGYEWVPSRDPKEHPVCSKCLAIYKAGGHEDALGDATGLDS